jgi:hypothetical protein
MASKLVGYVDSSTKLLTNQIVGYRAAPPACLRQIA